MYKLLWERYKPRKTTNDLLPSEKAKLSGIAAAVGVLVSNGLECRYIRRVGDIGRDSKFVR